MKLILFVGVMLVLTVSVAHSETHPQDCNFRCEPDPFPLCAKNRHGYTYIFDSSCHMDQFNCLHNEDYRFLHKGYCT